MKLSNIFICAMVPIFIASCAHKSAKPNKTLEPPQIETDQLSVLMQKTETNNSYVVNAKDKLQKLLQSKNFNEYISNEGILNCVNDQNQSACVLNFYLNEYYKLKYDVQIKKVIEDNQIEHKIELSKINATQANIKNYCDLSADFTAAVYTNNNDKISTFKTLFKMNKEDLSILHTKILKDDYSHFLIDENPSILQEMKTEFMEKCLHDPKNNIINYLNIFR
ncbi:hypothetical protein [Gilliamella apicola]|uniref:hypothetical protein n=1 Tax=Gilliamella apicola TaxID=1196095 RepID=UPI00080E7209|nr:hypothetical protein [Gilliamella apicola]OCG13233.1 hypothetical protein A9G14_03370 [Gilliamella apicola]ORF45930.1 hypothetical protein B5800_05325 [Gilliamella apicola]ORF49342.1 hypothetical protein B5799_05175 [Gilliamella apicola]ORF53837.1 hypothetical protein B5803_02520 [Gilliamella apicola]ORF55468.1 hypothetical protein B5798_03615 [Gilliamella apicola]